MFKYITTHGRYVYSIAIRLCFLNQNTQQVSISSIWAFYAISLYFFLSLSPYPPLSTYCFFQQESNNATNKSALACFSSSSSVYVCARECLHVYFDFFLSFACMAKWHFFSLSLSLFLSISLLVIVEERTSKHVYMLY